MRAINAKPKPRLRQRFLGSYKILAYLSPREPIYEASNKYWKNKRTPIIHPKLPVPTALPKSEKCQTAESFRLPLFAATGSCSRRSPTD